MADAKNELTPEQLMAARELLYSLEINDISEFHPFYCLYENVAKLASERDFAKAIELIEAIRKKLKEIMATENENIYSDEVYESCYSFLIFIAKHWPINYTGECPISLNEINDKNRFVLSDGHQFEVNSIFNNYKIREKAPHTHPFINNVTLDFRDANRIRAVITGLNKLSLWKKAGDIAYGLSLLTGMALCITMMVSLCSSLIGPGLLATLFVTYGAIILGLGITKAVCNYVAKRKEQLINPVNDPENTNPSDKSLFAKIQDLFTKKPESKLSAHAQVANHLSHQQRAPGELKEEKVDECFKNDARLRALYPNQSYPRRNINQHYICALSGKIMDFPVKINTRFYEKAVLECAVESGKMIVGKIKLQINQELKLQIEQFVVGEELLARSRKAPIAAQPPILGPSLSSSPSYPDKNFAF